MDPIRNPYAPGAGQRPPELAGRDGELRRLRRRARAGRPWPARALASCSPGCAASARPCCSTPCGRPPSGAQVGHRQARGAARHRAAPAARRGAAPGGPRARAAAAGEAATTCSASSRRSRSARACRRRRRAQAARPLAARASTCPAVTGRADSGDIEIDLVELLTDVAGLAADVGRGVAVFIDEMQDLGAGRRLRAVRRLPRDQPAGPAADRRRRRAAAPAGGAVGAQVVLASGCSATPGSTGSTASAADHALRAPAQRGGRGLHRRGARRDVRRDRRLPVLRPGLRQGRLGRRAALADHRGRRRVAAPEAEAELAVGFFGSRYERATPAEREYLRAMADLGRRGARAPDDPDAGGADGRASPTSSAASRSRCPRPGTP